MEEGKIANKVGEIEGRMMKLKTTGPAPSPRNSLSIAALGTNIYIFGGMREDFNTHKNDFYNDLYRLDTQKNTWEKLSPTGTLPSPRATAGAVGIKNKEEIFVFAGTFFGEGYSNLTVYDELWSYSPSKNQWTAIRPLNQPPVARAKPLVWNVEDKIYIFGGATAKLQMLNDLWCYDPKENTWTEIVPKNEPPKGRLEAVGGTTPSRQGFLTVYAGEGMDPAEGKKLKMLNDIWQYDLKNNLWKNVTPSENHMPLHNYTCAGIIGDYLYLEGGDLKGGLPSETTGFGAPFPQNVCNELWRFDLTKHIWKQIRAAGDTPPRIKQAGAVVVNDKLFIVGGYDFINKDGKGPGQIWNHDTFVYDPRA